MRRVLAAHVLCGAMTALAVTPARAAPDEGCAPSVRVTGDVDVAEGIRARLTERGLGEEANASCPSMRVRIERDGERLRIEVTDGYGRRSHREVRDASTAIALIESWVRPEVVGDDLPGAAPPGDVAPSVRSIVAARAAPTTSGIGLVAGAAYARDGTTWVRAGAAGCVAAGPVCIGGRIETARPTAAGDHPRQATSAAATVELPRRLGPLAVTPGVGVGGAWSTVSGFGPHRDETRDINSLRVLGTLALRLGIARRWAIELELGGEAEAIGGSPAVPGDLGRAAVGLRYGGW